MRSPSPRSSHFQYSYLIPAVVVLFAVSIFPLVFSIYMSLHRFVTIDPQTPFVGLANYEGLFANPDYANSLRVSAVYTAATVILALVLGLGLAVVLNQNLRGSTLFRAIVILPLTIAPIVVGFAWRFLLDPGQGLVGAFFLPLLGIVPRAILGDPNNALAAVVLADVWAKTPIMFLILLAGLQAIPQDLYRAVRIDGASRAAAFRHVTLPLLKPAIIVALMLKVIDSINAFDQIFVMTSGGPGNATQVFAFLGVRIAFQFFNLGQAAALGITMVIISSVAVGLMIRYLVK